MSNADKAVSCFKQSYNCAQAILSTYGPQLDLDYEIGLKLATAFGSGMARRGETCGAVTGAFMVISLKYGRIKKEDIDAREKTYELVEKFVKLFESRNGSIICKILLGCDLSTPEGMKYANEKNVIETLCPKFVKDAAEIIEYLL